VEAANCAEDIRTLLRHIPSTLLHDFSQLLHQVTLKVATLSMHHLRDLVQDALKQTKRKPEAPVVWLAFCQVLMDERMPLDAARQLLGHMKCMSVRPDSPHITNVFEQAQAAVRRRIAAPLALAHHIPQPQAEMLVDLFGIEWECLALPLMPPGSPSVGDRELIQRYLSLALRQNVADQRDCLLRWVGLAISSSPQSQQASHHNLLRLLLDVAGPLFDDVVYNMLSRQESFARPAQIDMLQCIAWVSSDCREDALTRLEELDQHESVQTIRALTSPPIQWEDKLHHIDTLLNELKQAAPAGGLAQVEQLLLLSTAPLDDAQHALLLQCLVAAFQEGLNGTPEAMPIQIGRWLERLPVPLAIAAFERLSTRQRERILAASSDTGGEVAQALTSHTYAPDQDHDQRV
jgi:hypothetical protein